MRRLNTLRRIRKAVAKGKYIGANVEIENGTLTFKRTMFVKDMRPLIDIRDITNFDVSGSKSTPYYVRRLKPKDNYINILDNRYEYWMVRRRHNWTLERNLVIIGLTLRQGILYVKAINK